MTAPLTTPRRSGPTTSGSPKAVAAVVLAAGLAFAAYPILRPYEDETTWAGAESVASGRWIASHTLAMISFGLLAYGLVRLAASVRGTTVARPARIAATCMVVGTALVLPYYGAETFGLQAIADEALRTGDLEVLKAFDTVRFDPVAASTFLAGLLLIGASGVYGAKALMGLAAGPTPAGRSTLATRGTAITFAAGWVLLLPQFFAPPAFRMAHGAIVLAGCALAARTIHRSHLPNVEAGPPTGR